MLAAHMGSATTVTFGFTSPAGDVGSNTHTYTSTPSGYSITAYGYRNYLPVDLYGKTSGGDESGLGLVGTSDHEIGPNAAIVFNISQLQSFNSLALEIGSVQSGESYEVLGSNSISGIYTPLVTNGSKFDDVFTTIPGALNYHYIAITAPTGDVLLNGLSASTLTTTQAPEPATFGLIAIALVGLSLISRRAQKR